jgi:hypothetical protein
MALVSPGIQISINDQSQYVATAVGSVPLVVLATAQDKTYNSASATGTSKAMAGKLQAFTSQRDLVTAMGTPTFQLTSANTPINGSELNEYGLMAAYSALGLGNQLFAIRADVDLDQLVGTSVRPTGPEADGTYWLDLANTEFGIYVWNQSTGSFTHVTPTIITDSTKVVIDSNFTNTTVSMPIASFGNAGDYALVCITPSGTTPGNIRLYYKATSLAASSISNSWVQVGSTNWQWCFPSASGSISQTSNPTIPNNGVFYINGSDGGHTITLPSTGTLLLTDVVNAINTASIAGVSAKVVNGYLNIYANDSAIDATVSPNVHSRITLTDGTNTPLAACGIVAKTYYAPNLYYGTFSQQPSWLSTDTAPKPTGSIWWKTTSTGQGYNPAIKQYNASLDQWTLLSAPAYSSFNSASYAIDPIGGGVNIAHGQLITIYVPTDGTSNSLRFFTEISAIQTVATGGTPSSSISGTISIQASAPGQLSLSTPVQIILSSQTSTQFVTAILNAQIPYVTATLNSNGTISIIHTSGGQISITNVSGTALAQAGFTSSSINGFTVDSVTGSINISNFTTITSTVTYSESTPYAAPSDGTLWYYSNPADVDIMINDSGWKGYHNVTTDARGYSLYTTSPGGVLVSASQPTAQSDNTSLAAGDLWLDTSDLENYPALSRYNGSAWIKIDNTDHVSSNGIVFADARWATSGAFNPISDALPSVTSLLTSNYIDLDAPDWRLYPRGTLLFNTRRSGYNVKKYVANYFNAASFPPASSGNNPANYPTTTPSHVDAWVSDSGLNEDGSMKAGTAAQRGIIVAAMQSAIDSNLDVREDIYNFNLICAPGYPELIPNMVTLNDDRGDTAFIIGDTPMTLMPNSIDLTAWSNNTTGTGLATASAYLGVYYPAGLTNDLAGNQIVVPASHAVLRTYMYNDNVSYPWFAPAGTHRGLVQNLSDIGYIDTTTGAFIHNGISQGVRDVLYSLNINPVTQLPGTGLVVWGQETRSGTSTARDRVNVVRLENYLRVIFKSIAASFLFEPNDTITRKTIATQIESALHDVLSKRGLTDFLVICDTSNNTSSTIANNQLYVDVAIEPMRDVEFIYIPIALYNPGVIAGLGLSST